MCPGEEEKFEELQVDICHQCLQGGVLAASLNSVAGNPQSQVKVFTETHQPCNPVLEGCPPNGYDGHPSFPVFFILLMGKYWKIWEGEDPWHLGSCKSERGGFLGFGHTPNP